MLEACWVRAGDMLDTKKEHGSYGPGICSERRRLVLETREMPELEQAYA